MELQTDCASLMDYIDYAASAGMTPGGSREAQLTVRWGMTPGGSREAQQTVRGGMTPGGSREAQQTVRGMRVGHACGERVWGTPAHNCQPNH